MINEEYKNEDGLIRIDYMRAHVSEEETNKIRCHPYSELLVIVKGNVIYGDNMGVSRVSDKSIVFTKAYEIHNPFVQYSHLYERYKILFDKNFVKKLLKSPYGIDDELSFSYRKQLSDNDFDEILGYVKSLYESMSSGGGSDSEILRRGMYLISALIKGADSVPRAETEEKNYISEVVEYIKNNYAEHLTIEALAATFFISRGKLIYDFKAYAGMSVLEYITMTRVDAAKKMLLSGYSVSSAAEKCGFSSSSYFIKVFSAITDMTPLKFQINFSKRALDKSE